MPLERRQWLGTWHVTDCQEGCNDIFCIPQNTLSFAAKEVQELTLRFEENHRTRSRKQCAGTVPYKIYKASGRHKEIF